MLACLPIQNKISSVSWICASLHLLGCYNHSPANIGFFFLLTPGVWNLYLCSTFDSNKNTMCFKEKQRAIEGNTNIYKWTYTTCKGCDKASDQGLYSADFMQVTLLSPRVLRFGAEILDSRIVTMGDCGLNTQMNSCLLIPKGHWKGEGL